MKIVKLNAAQFRLYLHNVPVLVFSKSGEVVEVDGAPRTVTKDETLAILKASKRHELFSVEVDGQPCHFVRGREFLARSLARKNGGPIQLRSPNGQMLLNYKPKHPSHDVLQSPVMPVEQERPYTPVLLNTKVAMNAPSQAFEVPKPENCPACSMYLKPTGCREDEHHPYCKYHDAYEAARPRPVVIASVEQKPETALPLSEPTKVEKSETLMVIDLETSEPLRTATSDEIEESQKAADESGFPTITRDGKTYGISTVNLVGA